MESSSKQELLEMKELPGSACKQRRGTQEVSEPQSVTPARNACAHLVAEAAGTSAGGKGEASCFREASESMMEHKVHARNGAGFHPAPVSKARGPEDKGSIFKCIIARGSSSNGNM
eukprot:1136823-Pelagomonas_calceolata.AAC.2